jgi:4-hydroxy-tetrahydrodipicolinate synthase
MPKQVAAMVRAFSAGKVSEAVKIHRKYYPVFKDLFIETNPVPVKAALAMMGIIAEEYRLPLVPMSPKNRETLKATLRACGVIKN